MCSTHCTPCTNFYCKKPTLSQIHSSRTDGHFYNLFGNYETPDVPHSSNPAGVLRTRQLEFAAWRCTGTHCNSSDTLLCQKLNHSLIPPPSTYWIRLWPTFFLFPKIKLKVKGTFFEDILAIQSACTAVLKAIPQTKFSRVFGGFYERCHEYYVEGWWE